TACGEPRKRHTLCTPCDGLQTPCPNSRSETRSDLTLRLGPLGSARERLPPGVNRTPVTKTAGGALFTKKRFEQTGSAGNLPVCGGTSMYERRLLPGQVFEPPRPRPAVAGLLFALLLFFGAGYEVVKRWPSIVPKSGSVSGTTPSSRPIPMGE